MCAKAALRRLDKNGVRIHFNPACFTIDAEVSGPSPPQLTGDRHGAGFRWVAMLASFVVPNGGSL